MPADAAASSPSVSELLQRIELLEAQLRARTTERDQAAIQQAATSEVLQVINSSPGKLEPVFDAMLVSATRLCDAAFGILWLCDGEHFHAAALHGVPERYAEIARVPVRPSPNNPLGRMLRGERVIVSVDAADDELYRTGDADRRALVDVGGARSFIQVALARDILLGSLTVYRVEARAFTEDQIALLKTFAAQAVIAIENARLLTEQREALEQQTATAQVLEIINSSPGNLAPVFDTILEKAHALCDVAIGSLELVDGTRFRAVASRNIPEALLSRLKDGFEPGPNHPLQQLLAGRDHVQVADMAKIDDPIAPIVLQGGHRTVLSVALRKDGKLLGRIVASRSEVRPFTEKDIALLQSFAAQAVIAMENARLLNAQREALEQQTATADILRVISQSPTDVQPVLDVVVNAALRFCGGQDALIGLRDDDQNVVPRAHAGTLGAGLVDVPAEHVRQLVIGQSISSGRTVHVWDPSMLDSDEARAVWTNHNVKAAVAAPMLREGVAIGTVLLRKQDAGPFTRRQIQLLEAFAAQAVIAIENVRLFTELREALEQQIATAEILRVISQSPTDVEPVLEALCSAARRYCGAGDAIVTLREGASMRVATHEGPLPARVGEIGPLDPTRLSGRCILQSKTFHVPDVDQLDRTEFSTTHELVRQQGFHAILAAPMLRDSVAIGSILLRKSDRGPFTPRQVQLLDTFAAQAVIAVENVRLFTELREALEQQTATAEILRAISQSPTDVQPVLDAVVKAAVRFCSATDAMIQLREGNTLISCAHEGPLSFVTGGRQLDRSSVGGRAIVDNRTFHYSDVEKLDPVEFSSSRSFAAQHGFRAAAAAPLKREDAVLGAVVLRKIEPGAFTQQQIALLESFAAQAVIAIENVRLFTELRDSLDRLKAAQANLIQAEKMASLGQLTAGIAHEIKNPLNFVNNFAGLSNELLDELKQVVGPLLGTDDPKRAEVQETMELLNSNLGKILEHGRRADGIVKSMLAHSRGGTGDWQSSNINGLIEEALNLAYHGARVQDQGFNVALERNFDPALKPLDVVPQDVTRVFLNVFGNGFYATRKRQRDNGEKDYQPTLKVSTRDLGEAVEVRVRDNGIGIAPELRNKLFQPFFTTKPTGEGTGLGLSISYDIVTQQHGGTIEVESEVGQYTALTVRLPRAQRATAGGR